MDDTKKMLRAIINGQSVMKQELLSEIGKVNIKVDGLEDEMKKGFNNMEKQLEAVNARIDKIGKQLAYLEDDAPTTEEFEELKGRVNKVEQVIASA